MLLNLHIKNMALIDEIDIDFGDHLNILTGETGAGKSIVIDSILLALGGKTPKDFVRKDAEYGLVELLFSVKDEVVLNQLAQLEVSDLSEGELILSRKIIGNRSVCKVNGETVTISKVREIAAFLLDLHAQHEHQSLLIPANHLKLLDRYGHDSLDELKHDVKALYLEYVAIKKEVSEHSLNEEEKKRQLDLLEYEINEITQANLSIGEDENLEEQYRRIANNKNITDSLSAAYHYTDDVAFEAIDRAIREMTSVSTYDEELQSMADALATVSDLVSEFGRNARNYLEENTFSEEDFRTIENRLNILNHLKSKYGKSIQEVLDYRSDIEERYEKLTNQDVYLAKRKEMLAEVEAKLLVACNKLTKERQRIADQLTKEIIKALQDLNFLDVRFDVVFDVLDHYSEQGIDSPYFVISTNIGEEPKPLWQVASGGELSRIMLALKSCLADMDGIESLIFDEIDVGISGRTAQMVAEKICGIGRNHQVICITHLPQIAAMADHHYLIEKQVNNGKTITSIQSLNQEEQVEEIARLLGGVSITDTVLENAKEMKELATKAKVN